MTYPTPHAPRHYAAAILALPEPERATALEQVPAAVRAWVADHLAVAGQARDRQRARRKALVHIAAGITRLRTREQRRVALDAVRPAARPAVERIVRRLWTRRAAA